MRSPRRSAGRCRRVRRDRRRGCDNASDLAALAALPATTVLAISNLGAPILAHTHHRVLAGPYHRNVAGNLLALQAFMGSDAQAAAIAGGNGIGLVVLCRGNDETSALSEWAPSGFIASLSGGTVPRWLARVPGRRRRDARNLSHLEAALIAQRGITLRNADRPKNRGAARRIAGQYTSRDTFPKPFAGNVPRKRPFKSSGRK